MRRTSWLARSVDLTATLRDFGHAARKHQAVDLLVDHQTAGRQYVDVPAGGEATRAISPSLRHARRARSGSPPRRATTWKSTTGRYLVVNVRQAIRVLCIDGRPAGDPTRRRVLALSNALLAQSDPSERPPIEVDVAPESGVLERRLARHTIA